ncbi:GNAT family N-acetyltransferase [Luedemannella flava]|uniref:GNAT family N-acetyltransferase n=1 Tax=Luedemannella flava TaxID=349316 RepID=A0ABP4XVP2_9ACTN
MIEEVPLDDILDLRWRVLRPGQPRDSAMFAEDRRPGSFHLAYRDEAGDVVSCVTFIPQDLDGQPAWRFRGMATDEAQRGRGLGSEVLAAGLAGVAARGGGLVWCNARVSALEFYRRHGFAQRGEIFDIPNIGPHVVLTRHVD